MKMKTQPIRTYGTQQRQSYKKSLESRLHILKTQKDLK
jgi:hypothetical protein